MKRKVGEFVMMGMMAKQQGAPLTRRDVARLRQGVQRAVRASQAARQAAQAVPQPQQPQGALYVGLDLGQAHDYTALSILEAPPEGDAPADTSAAGGYQLRHLERPELGTPYPAIVARVASLLGSPQLQARQVEALVIDATGVGRAVLDMFREADLPVSIVPVTITSGSRVTHTEGMWYVPKRDLVGALEALTQNRRLRMPSERRMPLTAILKAELLNFKAKISAAGHDSYEAGGASDWREGQHDDLVLSVALVAWWLTRWSATIPIAVTHLHAEDTLSVPYLPPGVTADDLSAEQMEQVEHLAHSLNWLNGLPGGRW